MLDTIVDLLLSLAQGALTWILAFIVGFAAIMLIIAGIVKVSGKMKKAKPDEALLPVDFVETPEYIQQICEVMRLLSDNDKQLAAVLPLFACNKTMFAQKHIAS